MTRAGAMKRLAYGALFLVVLPVGLVGWALATNPMVPLPAVHSRTAGAALIGLGLLLLGAGARELIARGGGLPMNAFPPPRLVRSGIYRWIRNPMYIGVGLVCAGASIASGSPAGLWLVTPLVCLGATALLYGFERGDLTRRFGEGALNPPQLSLPRGDGEPPTASHRLAVIVWVLIPWLVAYYAVQALGRAPDAFRTALPFERHWPVWPWSELFYASVYVFVPLTVLLVRTRRDLRRFAIQGGLAIPIVTLVWLTVPVVAANRPFAPLGPLDRLLAFEQGHSNGVAAFPAFHVLWALIAADAWEANARSSRRSVWAWAGWTWATLITVSCITTAMHTLLEVGAAILLFLPLRRYEVVWKGVRLATERIANSWKEWRLGPVRVINHGAYAAAAAGVGLLVAGSAAGRERFGAVIWVGWCILIGAGLLAQVLEGSSKLLRPFGWYGGVLGGVFGAFTARLTGAPILPLLAAFAIAAPWIQILGRLRCLVQGCCHGGPARSDAGIRYLHRRSRVTQLANLAGVPIHPTPLYSITANFVLGVLLLRLHSLATPDSLVVGIYLMLAGMARFVEESYRGEPQTPVIAGLRLYQWLAIVSVVMGAVCTTLPAASTRAGFTAPDPPLLWAALVMALLTGFAMGIDFPASNQRFSRLAPAD